MSGAEQPSLHPPHPLHSMGQVRLPGSPGTRTPSQMQGQNACPHTRGDRSAACSYLADRCAPPPVEGRPWVPRRRLGQAGPGEAAGSRAGRDTGHTGRKRRIGEREAGGRAQGLPRVLTFSPAFKVSTSSPKTERAGKGPRRAVT